MNFPTPGAWELTLELVITSGLGVLGIIGVLVTIGVTQSATRKTLEQQDRHRRDDELYRRMEWAVEAALADDEGKRTAGTLVITRLIDSETARNSGFTISDLDRQLMLDVAKISFEKSQEDE